MVFYLILSILCLLVVGLAKGTCDSISFHFSTSIFRNRNPLFWNPALSWQNKYKPKDPDAVGYTPKFWGSNTYFVALTDAWHLFQLVQNMAICAACVCLALAAQAYPLSIGALQAVVAFGVLRTILQVGFMAVYR